MRFGIVLAFVAAAGYSGVMRRTSPERPGGVTLAIVNARVWTGDPSRPWAEALAIAGDRISAVGTTTEIRALANGAEIVDGTGRLVVPGFIDTHVHFVDGGVRLASVQLRDAKTQDEFVARIQSFAATVPAGTWITGGDWDHFLWGGELPTRAWIDAVTPDHPVWVNRLDGHMALANSAALAKAGITKATPEVTGGEIVRRPDGEPAGIIKDNAMPLVDRVVPPPAASTEDRALALAMKYVNERGVTSVHDMSMGTWDSLAVFARARKAGTLTVRLYSAAPLADWKRLADIVTSREFGGADGRGDEWLRIGALKGFVDGSLGSHTAAFHEPFTDAPADRGLLVNAPEDLYTWISAADAAGLHVLVHACGDRANTVLLDIYERVTREHGPRDRRFRIEHAQHLTPADISRFARLDVIASMQPYHAIDDGRWAERFIGDRIRTTYAFRSLLDAKARIAFGSDWFVAPPAPLAVTRRTIDDKNPGGWVPAQRITVEEALRAYTVDAAYASFEEGLKGTITPGRLADVVMLDRNIFDIPPEQIRDVRVAMTVAGGRAVYREDQGTSEARQGHE
jgi:predicted amidohydrolase YtcJ